jgi:hypothetical protein
VTTATLVPIIPDDGVPASISGPTHDREWWAKEAARVGSDWAGILATHFAALQQLGLVESEPSSFQIACERADRARKRGRR